MAWSRGSWKFHGLIGYARSNRNCADLAECIVVYTPLLYFTYQSNELYPTINDYCKMHPHEQPKGENAEEKNEKSMESHGEMQNHESRLMR